MSWSKTVLKIKLTGAKLNLQEELKKKPMHQNKARIKSLQSQITDFENKLKDV